MDTVAEQPCEHDLAIVGAGPAGTATALALLQRDPSWARRMVLIDRAVHPRPKLCGGAITPLGLEVLDALGLGLEVPHQAPPEMRVRFEGVEQSFFFEPALRVVERARFDHWLLERVRAQGVAVLEGTQVDDARRDDAGVTLRAGGRALRARAVVAADGSRGPMRRLLGLERGGARARLLEVFTPLSEREQREDLARAARFDFDVLRDDVQGYCWDFPCEVDGAPAMNRGVFDARVHPQRGPGSLRPVLARHLAPLGEAGATARVQGHPIRVFVPGTPISRPRALLVGDTAGVDPLLGEGISFALQFGRVAADVLHDGFARGDLGFARYARAVAADPILARLSTRHRRARWLYRRRPGIAARALWRLGPMCMRLLYR